MKIYCIMHDDGFDSVWVSLITEDKKLFNERWNEVQEMPETQKQKYYNMEWENGVELL